MAKSNWKTTKETAKALGISPDKLKQWALAGVLERGKHYRDISIEKKRPTYRWNLDEINHFLDTLVG